MTPETAKKLLPIITAFANGETIEYQARSGDWGPAGSFSFQAEASRYRIKPKQPEYRLFEHTNGALSCIKRNSNFGDTPTRTIELYQKWIDEDEGRWFTDWLPLPETK